MMHIDRRKAPRLTPFEAHCVHAMTLRIKLQNGADDVEKLTLMIKYHEAQCALLAEETDV